MRSMGRRCSTSMTAQVAFLKMKGRYGHTGLVVECTIMAPFGKNFVVYSYHFFKLLACLAGIWVTSPVVLKLMPTICAKALGILYERGMAPDLITLTNLRSFSGISSASAMIISLGNRFHKFLHRFRMKGLG